MDTDLKYIKNILLVEDDPQDAELTLAALEEHHLANKVAVESRNSRRPIQNLASALRCLFGDDWHAYSYLPPGTAATRVFLAATGKTLGFSLETCAGTHARRFDFRKAVMWIPKLIPLRGGYSAPAGRSIN